MLGAFRLCEVDIIWFLGLRLTCGVRLRYVVTYSGLVFLDVGLMISVSCLWDDILDCGWGNFGCGLVARA